MREALGSALKDELSQLFLLSLVGLVLANELVMVIFIPRYLGLSACGSLEFDELRIILYGIHLILGALSFLEVGGCRVFNDHLVWTK